VSAVIIVTKASRRFKQNLTAWQLCRNLDEINISYKNFKKIINDKTRNLVGKFGTLLGQLLPLVVVRHTTAPTVK